MKLNAKVTAIYSSASYKDSKQRVQIHVEGGDTAYKSFIVPNDDLVLDDELVVLVMTAEQAARVVGDYDVIMKIYVADHQSDVPISGELRKLADQLRPGSAPDTTETQEFRLGGAA